jgi:hypothetical protein
MGLRLKNSLKIESVAGYIRRSRSGGTWIESLASLDQLTKRKALVPRAIFSGSVATCDFFGSVATCDFCGSVAKCGFLERRDLSRNQRAAF